MKRIWPFVTVGVIISVAGLIFSLQGTNVIHGSSMSGSSLWAVLGPIIFLVGLAVIALALIIGRRRRGAR